MSTQWRPSVVFTLLIVSLNDVCVLSQNVGPFVLEPPAFQNNNILSGYPDLNFDPDYQLLSSMLTLAEENGVLPEFIQAILGPEDFIVNDNPQRFSIMPEFRSLNAEQLREVQFDRAVSPGLILETQLKKETKPELVLETPLNREVNTNLVLETQLNRGIAPKLVLETQLNRGLTPNNILYDTQLHRGVSTDLVLETQLNRGMGPDLVFETQLNRGIGSELILESQLNRGLAPNIIFEGPLNRAITPDLVLETQVNRGMAPDLILESQNRGMGPELILESQLNRGLGPELILETHVKRDILNPVMLPTPNPPQFASKDNSIHFPLVAPPTAPCLIPKDLMPPYIPSPTSSPKPASASPVGIVRPLIRNKNGKKSNCTVKPEISEYKNLNSPSANFLPSQGNFGSFIQSPLNLFSNPVLENYPSYAPQQPLNPINLLLQEQKQIPQKSLPDPKLPGSPTMQLQPPLSLSSTTNCPKLPLVEMKVEQKVTKLESPKLSQQQIPCQQFIENYPLYQTSEKYQSPVFKIPPPVLSPQSQNSQSMDNCPITFTEKPYFNPASGISVLPQKLVVDTIDECPVAPSPSRMTFSRLTPPLKQSVVMSQSENLNAPSIPDRRYQPLSSIPNVKTPLLRQSRPDVKIPEQPFEICKETINHFKPVSSQLFTSPPTVASTNCSPSLLKKPFSDPLVNLDLSPFQQSLPTEANINCPTLLPKTTLQFTQAETLPISQQYLDILKTPCSKSNRLTFTKMSTPQLTSNNLQLKESNTASLAQSVAYSERSTNNPCGLSKQFTDSTVVNNLRNKVSNTILQQSNNPTPTNGCSASTANLPNKETANTVSTINRRLSQYYTPNSCETNNCNSISPSTVPEINQVSNAFTTIFPLSQQSFLDQLAINPFASKQSLKYMPINLPFFSQDYTYLQPVSVIPIINPIPTFMVPELRQHTLTNIQDTSPVVVLPEENCENTAVASVASAEANVDLQSVGVKEEVENVMSTLLPNDLSSQIQDDSVKVTDIAINPPLDVPNALPVTVSAPKITLSPSSPTTPVSSFPRFPIFPVYPPPMPIIVDSPRSKSRDWLPVLLVALLGNCGNCGSNNCYGYCNSCCNNQNMPCPIPISLCDPIVSTTDTNSCPKSRTIADCGSISINIINDDNSGIITVEDDE